MSRSVWKGPFVSLKTISSNFVQPIKIWVKSLTISESLIGKFVFIYNGKSFKKVFINREKVGFKFGEFITTRSFNYSKKHKKKLIPKKK